MASHPTPSPSDRLERGVPADRSRPALGDHRSHQPDALDAVDHLVGELQAGWDDGDARITNRHFAADIVWGSPFGATVHGYDELHAIHTRLKRQGTGGASSRFEVVGVLAPTEDVVVAQIRRQALDQDGRPVEPAADPDGAFSEMALYVLVRRDGTWWVAAGQNTPIRPAPG